jgi:hypothetical protein
MYQSFTTKSGAAVAAANLAAFAVQSGPDGLSVDTAKLAFPVTASMPQRLYDWLVGLRLLRNVPLSYLVPDAALLPPEAIRFFHVDLTWVDRVIDGVFSAANTGTLDIVYSAGILAAVRATLDLGLEGLAKDQVDGSTWKAADGMTGMLVRSDLVRRWPDMIVRGYAGQSESSAEVAVLRCEPISKDILIAIFAGTPALVQVREPHVGVRFGVEPREPASTPQTYHVDLRDTNGNIVTVSPGSAAPKQITFTLPASRVLPIRQQIVAAQGVGDDARMVAIQLMRQPYVQQFGHSIQEKTSTGFKTVTVEEPRGCTNPPPTRSFGPGRFMNVASMVSRQAELARLGKS